MVKKNSQKRKLKKRLRIKWGRVIILILPIIFIIIVLNLVSNGMDKVLSNQKSKVVEQKEVKDEQEVKKETPKIKPIVVIDAGKGGANNGVTKNGIKEKDINLLIANKLATKLNDYGISVKMTRDSDTDTSIEQRLSKINKANLMLSLHCNYVVDESVNGIETYYYRATEVSDTNLQSEKLANTLQKYMLSWIPTQDRGVRLTNLELLKKSTIPTVMIQMGFISNIQEAKNLQDDNYQKLLIDALAEGIVNYLNYY